MKHYIYCLALILLPAAVFAMVNPQLNQPVPGGVAVIALPYHGDGLPKSYFQQRRTLVYRDQQQHWFAVVGLPLSIKTGKHVLIYQADHQQQKHYFSVHQAHYPTQYLTIKNRRKVDPHPADLKRIQRESAHIKRILSGWTATQTVPLQLRLPLHGPESSAFGLRRFYNKKPRSPHSGLDIAAPTGTKVTAPAAGKVAATGHFFFLGNAIFIDHGMGLFTVYAHLSAIKVKPDQTVKAGQLIGLVGATGRVTGPHLHWGVVLNGVFVNPKLFIAEAATQ